MRLLYAMSVLLTCACMCYKHPWYPRGQNRMLNPPEQGSQMMVNHWIDVGMECRSSARTRRALSWWVITPHPREKAFCQRKNQQQTDLESSNYNYRTLWLWNATVCVCAYAHTRAYMCLYAYAHVCACVCVDVDACVFYIQLDFLLINILFKMF